VPHRVCAGEAPSSAGRWWWSGTGSNCRPSANQAGHMPSWHGSCERYALPPVAVACHWSLLLLSPLLSIRFRASERLWSVIGQDHPALPAMASSSRTSGAAGRLVVVPASSVCWRSCLLATVRGRCCTPVLYCVPHHPLAARVVAVRIGSGWTNVPDRPALAAAARYRTATRTATVPSAWESVPSGLDAALNTVR
jgi:hypothetical protein